MEVFSQSTGETENLAQRVAKGLKPGDVLALYGGLGSGKTTFVGFLVEALGIYARVLSPTFVVLRCYSGGGGLIKAVNHVDLYRMQSREEVFALGLQEIFSEEDAITVIEWPELAENYLPETSKKIYFEYVAENIRKINLGHV